MPNGGYCLYNLFLVTLKGQCDENHFKNTRVQKHIYINGKLQVVVHFLKNSNVSVKKLKKDVISLLILTTETQALNLKSSGGIFQVLPFWLEKIA